MTGAVVEIVHLVLVEWAPHTTATDLNHVRTIARGMAGSIPGIIRLDEGPSVSPEGLEQHLDYGLVITFADSVARDAYLPHAAHQVLVEQFRHLAARVVVFDLAASQPAP